MRNLSVLSLCSLFLAAGCANVAQSQSRARVVPGGDVCVAAARTSGETPVGAARGCRSITTTSAECDDCRSCLYEYAAAETLRERAAGHRTDCCYSIRCPVRVGDPGEGLVPRILE